MYYHINIYIFIRVLLFKGDNGERQGGQMKKRASSCMLLQQGFLKVPYIPSVHSQLCAFSELYHGPLLSDEEG